MSYYILNFIPAKGAIPDFRGYLGEIQLVETCHTEEEAVAAAEQRAEINYENSYAVVRKGQITPFFSRAQCCKLASEEVPECKPGTADNLSNSFEKTLLENTIVEQIMANSAYAMSVEENITTLRNLLDEIRTGEISEKPKCQKVNLKPSSDEKLLITKDSPRSVTDLKIEQQSELSTLAKSPEKIQSDSDAESSVFEDSPEKSTSPLFVGKNKTNRKSSYELSDEEN